MELTLCMKCLEETKDCRCTEVKKDFRNSEDVPSPSLLEYDGDPE